MNSIIVDISKIDNLNCGLGQFSYHLSKELAEINSEVRFYYSPKVTGAEEQVEKRRLPSSKLHRKLPFFAPRAELWHATHQDCDLYPVKGEGLGVLTIHDLNYLAEESDETKKNHYLQRLQKKIDKSHAVVFISEFTKSDVAKHLDLNGCEKVVIPNGISLQNEAGAERPKDMPFDKGDYFFGISTVVPKKNYHLLIKVAIRRPHDKFVIAGDLFHKYAKELQEEVQKNGLADRFFFPGKVSEKEKNYLYENAKAFVHPSLLEGFGLPLVEALSFGKAVLCSHLCSMPEVVGPDGFYFDPFDLESVLQTFERFEKSAISPNDLKKRAEMFSWKNAAKSYSDLYLKLLHDRS